MSNLPLPSSRRSRGDRGALAHTGRATRDTSTSRWTEVEREERKPHGMQYKVHPETPPPSLLACPPEGREEEEEQASGRKTFEEVAAEGGREPERRDGPLFIGMLFTKASHCDGDHPTQKSQVMFLVQILPLHLV